MSFLGQQISNLFPKDWRWKRPRPRGLARIENCLDNAGIRTFKDLVEMPEANLFRAKNYGFRSHQILRDLMKRQGIEFVTRYNPPEKISNLREIDGHKYLVTHSRYCECRKV